MKSFLSKLLAVVFVFILATGCASSLTAPTQPNQQKTIQKKAPAPNNVTGNTDMDGSVKKPG